MERTCRKLDRKRSGCKKKYPRGGKKIWEQRGCGSRGVYQDNTRRIHTDGLLWNRVHNQGNKPGENITNNDKQYNKIDTPSAAVIREQNPVRRNRYRTA